MARKDVTDEQVCLVVKIYRHRCSPGHRPLKLLKEWTGEPEKVCYRAMERSFRRGYLEYGTGLYIPWLTDKGELFLSNHFKSQLNNKPMRMLC